MIEHPRRRLVPLFLLALALLLLPTSLVAVETGAEKSDEKWSVADPPIPGFYDVEIDVDEGTWINLDVSPDGSQIVFDLLGDLYLLPIAGGEAEALTSGLDWDMQPRFSPDGTEVAFTSDRDGGDNIWVIGLDDLDGPAAGSDGRAVRQISREKHRLPNSPAWSPDGEYIAARKHFSSTRSLGTGEIWLWHASGTGSGLQLNEKPNEQKDLGEPAFSPDGRHVYFSQDTTPGPFFEYSKDSNTEIYTIRRVDRETGEIETVVSGPGGAVRPTPSPDGKWLAFVRRERFQSKLFLHDLESGRNVEVFDSLDRDMQEIWAIHGVYPGMAWTPDSRSIVFWAGGKIRRLDLESGEATVIPFRVRQTLRQREALRFPVEVHPERFRTRMLRWPTVSPDGSKVVFQALGRLWLRELDGGSVGEARRLTTQDEHFELYPSWSRDGRSIVYVSWDDDELGAVRRLSVAEAGRVDAGTVLTREPGHYVEPVLSPDGSTLVYRKIEGGFLTSPIWSKEPGLWTLALDDRGLPDAEARRLLPRGVVQPHFGADPDRVYFVEAEAWNERYLRSIRLDGTEPREHAKSEVATEMRVSPDGDRLAFVERFDVFVTPFTAASDAIAVGPDMGSLPVKRVSPDAGEYLHWSGSGDDSKLHWSLGPELFGVEVETALAATGFGDDDEGQGEGESGAAAEERAEGVDSRPAGIDLGFEVASERPGGTIAFLGGKVLTMTGDDASGSDVIENGTVLVEGNRIVAVGPEGEVDVPTGAFVVDARGKTVMPGLIDVHWHGPQGISEIVPEENWENDAGLAFGVTTIHDPSNDTSTIFAAAEMARAGLIRAPRIFSTGTILYGAFGDFRAIVDSVDDAREHLRRLQAVGAISVKSYNQPRRDQRQMIVKAGEELGMMVVNEGGALFNHNMTMVADGHTGIEHSLSVGAIYDDVLQFWGQTTGPGGVGVGNTPTLGVAFGGIEGERYWYHHTDVFANPRLLSFVPQALIDARARRRVMAPEEEYNHILAARVVKQLLDAGVSIQLGAHGQREGLAAHWEMWMFEQGGMTPMEALRAGTIAGARYVGLDGDVGSLAPGKLADVIVIDGDPLADLRQSERVSHTMVNGRLWDAATLEQLAPEEEPGPSYWWQEDEAVFPVTSP